VARGSGTSVKLVSELLSEHKRVASAVKKMKALKIGKRGMPDMAAMFKALSGPSR